MVSVISGFAYVHHVHRTGDWRLVLTLVVLLVAMTLVAYVRILRPPSRRLDLLVLAGCVVVAVIWVAQAVVPEGAVLISFNRAHGLTESDLLVFPLLAAGCWLGVRLIWSKEDRESDGVEALR